MAYLRIDNMRFNENHITYIEPIEKVTTFGTNYKVKIVSQPETYEGETLFRTRKECEKYIDKCLGYRMEDNTSENN